MYTCQYIRLSVALSMFENLKKVLYKTKADESRHEDRYSDKVRAILLEFCWS